jgi:hypothetical protein
MCIWTESTVKQWYERILEDFQPDTFDQIENEIRTFSQNYKYISLFGDFNSRTAEEPDFIDFEIN